MFTGLNLIQPFISCYSGTSAYIGIRRNMHGFYDNEDMIIQNIQAPIAPPDGDTDNECVVVSKVNMTTLRMNCSVANHYVCRYNYLHNAIIQVSTDHRTWNGADDTCQAIGGQLLSLHSKEQKRVINTILAKR